jgi:uncharacterized protein
MPAAPICAMTYEYVEGILERRKPHREDHLALIDRFSRDHGLVIAGATGEPPTGALFVFEGDPDAIAHAEAFRESDPYVHAGLVVDSRIEPLAVVASRPLDAR